MVFIKFNFFLSSNPIKDCAGAPRLSPPPPGRPATGSSVRQRGSRHWRRKHGLQGRARRTTTWPRPKGPVRQGAVGPKSADHRGPQGTGQSAWGRCPWSRPAGRSGAKPPAPPDEVRPARLRRGTCGRGDNFPGQCPVARAAGDNHLEAFFLHQPSGQAGPVGPRARVWWASGPGVQDYHEAPGFPELDDLNSRGIQAQAEDGRRGRCAQVPGDVEVAPETA